VSKLIGLKEGDPPFMRRKKPVYVKEKSGGIFCSIPITTL
jgi:hypothetical protein